MCAAAETHRRLRLFALNASALIISLCFCACPCLYVIDARHKKRADFGDIFDGIIVFLLLVVVAGAKSLRAMAVAADDADHYSACARARSFRFLCIIDGA